MVSFLGEGPKRILVVQNDVELRDQLKLILTECGFDIGLAATAFEAMDLLRSRPNGWDYLVADHAMPGISGSDLLIWCRVWGIPLRGAVLLTGSPPPQLKSAEFLAELPLTVLSKPIRPTEIVRALA